MQTTRMIGPILTLFGIAGCYAPPGGEASRPRPSIAPSSQPATSPAERAWAAGTNPLQLEAPDIQPLHRDILAIDLSAVVQAARADNLEILRARQQSEAAIGQYQSLLGGAFPVIAPNIAFERVEGTVRAVQGNLVGAAFNTFQPAIAVQWITNPGQVIYQLIAARKRLSAVEHQEEAVILESTRTSAVQFYDLMLAQTRVATARQSVAEAEELLRVSRLRARTGTGVQADVLRAEARLAERQQELVSSVEAFYRASVELALTLHLDSSVTLVPRSPDLALATLVRPDIPLDDLLEFAVVYRPDLAAVRELVKAAAAARGATWWGSFGPQFQLAYQYGGILGHASNVVPGQGIPGNLVVNPASPTGTFSTNPLVNGAVREGIARGSARLAGTRDQSTGLHDQQRFNAAGGWRFTLAAFGDLRTARAAREQAIVEAEQQVDRVRAQVILAREAIRASQDVTRLAGRQVEAAREALRLTQANLQAGTMTTLDVLQAQDAVTQARLRYVEAVVRHNQSQVNLVAAVGLLNEDTILAR